MTSFIISDTHFSHENSWKKFKLPNGEPLRPFSSTEEMDETMVERWNSVVSPGDRVYHLGDVAISKRGLEFVKRLNGKKRLIMGNHDIYGHQKYLDAGFQKIMACRVFVDKWILTHIPLHPDSVTERFRVNVTGHLHANQVMMPNPIPELRHTQVPDPRYFCASVEQINYTPISFEELEERIQKRWEEANYTPPANAGWGNGSGPG